MKIVVKIVIGIVTFIAILLLVAVFIKKDYTVQREISINKPKQEVFEYIKNIKNQKHYSVWGMKDPNAKIDYKGTDGSVGFVHSWDGNKEVGKGEQEIKSITEGERIDVELRFYKPFEGIANAFLATESISDSQTKVKWSFSSAMPYPMNLMRIFCNVDNMMGKDMETGLVNLKNILEKQ